MMTEPTPAQLSRQGKQTYQSGNFAEAARIFEQAASAFDAASKPLDAAEMRNNASVAWLQANQPQQALDILSGSAAVFEAADDLKRWGLALGNEGAALDALKRYDEAAEKYSQSAEVLEAAGEDQMRAEVLKALSALQLKTGKQFDAVLSMQSGLAGIKKPTLKQKILRQLLRMRIW